MSARISPSNVLTVRLQTESRSGAGTIVVAVGSSTPFRSCGRIATQSFGRGFGDGSTVAEVTFPPENRRLSIDAFLPDLYSARNSCGTTRPFDTRPLALSVPDVS